MSSNEMPHAPSAALDTSEGARRYVADFFARELRRHDFTRYITTTLAADFACALAQHLAATGRQQVGELQGEALKQLQELISRIHSTVSLGHQTGPHAYAGEDFGRYLAEAAGDCEQIMRALAALAARQPGAQEPVGTIRDRDGVFEIELSESAHNTDAGALDGRAVYLAPPAQAVDLLPIVKLAYGLLWMSSGDPAESQFGLLPNGADRAREVLRDAMSKDQCGDGITAARALIDQRDAAPGVGQ